MTNNETDFWNKYPEMICHSIVMEEPNQTIPIYSGDFLLRNGDYNMSLNGEIKFDWLPTIKVSFKGIVLESNINPIRMFHLNSEIELIVGDFVFGKCQISGSLINKNTEISGFMIKDPFLGDRTIQVDSIRFTIPNFKNFHSDPIKHTVGEKVHFNRRRLMFTDDEYLIALDGLHNYDSLKEKLSQKGGYIIQYNGEISRRNKPMNYHDIHDILQCLSCFLSFINGRRIATIFHQGIFDNKIIWTDYSGYKNDMYKIVFTWSVWDDTSNFNEIWNSFKKLWSNEMDRDFINSAIHWYLEANKNSGYVEGSIILTQIGLELIYNWFVIEKKRIILGKDAENISASNKIRLFVISNKCFN